jgi:hypothetical protein
MTPQEFAAKIKAKNPNLKNVDDLTLTKNVLRAHPEFSSMVTLPKEQSKPSMQQAQPEQKKSMLRKVGDFFTSSEQAFGQTLGTAVSVFDPEVNKNRNAVMQQAQTQYANYIKLAQQSTDKNKKKAYLEAARKAADVEGVDIFSNPEYQKTAKQIFGEAAGVVLDYATAGTLAKGGKIANEAYKAGKAAEKLAPSAFKAAGKASLVGAGYGSAYNVSSAMQQNASNKDIAKSGAIGAVTGAVTAGVVSLGASKISNVVKFGPGKAGNKQAENLNKIFDNSTNTIRKQANFVADKGKDLGTSITERGIKPTVKNERLVFNKKHIAELEKEIAEKSSIIDEAAELYPVKLTASELKKKAKQLTYNNPALRSEGRTHELYSKAAKKIDDYAMQNGSDEFSVSQIQDMKKGMYGLSKKYKISDIGRSDAYSELGSVFMKIVEDEIPDVSVKNLNKEIGGAIQLKNFLETVNSKGGIVLEGGRLGKRFSQLAGTLTGAGAGSMVAGPAGAVIGGAVGNKVAFVLRNLSQKSSILGPIDRLLIKGLKKAPKDAELMLAKKFIDEVKNGKTLTASKRVEGIIQKILFPKQPLMLPAPKPGSTKVGIGTPINLGPKSQSTLDIEEAQRLWWARYKKHVPTQKALPPGVIKLGPKK